MTDDRPTPEDIANAVTPVDETLWERRYQAVSLRNGGMTFDQIAQVQKISPAQVRKDVALAKREIMAEPVEDMVARQRAVLLDLQRGLYPMALRGTKDSPPAVNSIVRLLEQEAKLLGLYRPAQVHIGVSDVQFRDRATELILALRPDTLKELTRGNTNAIDPRPDRDDPASDTDDVGDDDDAAIDAEVVDLPTAGGGGDRRAAEGVVRPAEPEPPVDAGPDDDDWANL